MNTSGTRREHDPIEKYWPMCQQKTTCHEAFASSFVYSPNETVPAASAVHVIADFLGRIELSALRFAREASVSLHSCFPVPFFSCSGLDGAW